jgi:hypothetical protein
VFGSAIEWFESSGRKEEKNEKIFFSLSLRRKEEQNDDGLFADRNGCDALFR